MKKEQVWATEASVQVKFERQEEGGTVKITPIRKAENGYEYEDTQHCLNITGWRWDRVVEALK